MTYPLDTRAETFAAEMPGYFLGQYFGASVLTALVEGILAPFEDVETAIQTLTGYFGVDNAVGDWLDAVGENVGERRDGKTDADYRRAIRTRVRINRSRGTADDLFGVISSYLADAPESFRLYEWSGAFDIFVADATYQEDVATLRRVVDASKVAGVNASVIYMASELEDYAATGPGTGVGPFVADYDGAAISGVAVLNTEHSGTITGDRAYLTGRT